MRQWYVARGACRRGGGAGPRGAFRGAGPCSARGQRGCGGAERGSKTGVIRSHFPVHGGKQPDDGRLVGVRLLGDAGGRLTTDGERRGGALARGQRVRLGAVQQTGAWPGRRQLLAGPLDQAVGTALDRRFEPAVEGVGGVLGAAGATQFGARTDQRAGEFVGRGRALQVADGLLEELDARGARRDLGGDPQGLPDRKATRCSWSPPRADATVQPLTAARRRASARREALPRPARPAKAMSAPRGLSRGSAPSRDKPHSSLNASSTAASSLSRSKRVRLPWVT